MISIEYRPVPDRVMPYYSVWVTMPAPCPPMLIGFVSLGGKTWTAKLRSDDKPTDGWLRRSDAAAWLLIAGKFAQQRQVAA